jgi:hypothetical protein
MFHCGASQKRPSEEKPVRDCNEGTFHKALLVSDSYKERREDSNNRQKDTHHRGVKTNTYSRIRTIRLYSNGKTNLPVSEEADDDDYMSTIVLVAAFGDDE